MDFFHCVVTPTVTVTAPNNTHTVGQPLTLTCSVTTMNAITGGIVIVWRRDGTEFVGAREAITSPTAMMGGSVMYTDTDHCPQMMMECFTSVK